METDPGVVLGFTKVTNDKQSRSSRGKKSVVGGDAVEGQKLVGTVVRLRAPCNPSRILVSKCSWTHVGLSRLKREIVTPWDRQNLFRRTRAWCMGWTVNPWLAGIVTQMRSQVLE